MKFRRLLTPRLTLTGAVPAFCLLAAPLQSQSAEDPVYTQTLWYIKVAPGKGNEYVQFLNETFMKVAQMRADAGEILTWTLLRSVYPAGQEARADYLISVISEGPPTPPVGREQFAQRLKKAGVSMSAADVNAKGSSLSTVVAQEMWRPRIRIGAAQKGHFLYLNSMKVLNAADYSAFERDIWRPLAEEWVKQGAMSGWIFATKMLPSGSETPYSACSVDIYPTWDAVFKSLSTQETFAKVHPGKNYEQTMGELGKLRDLARRELWEVVERVEKKK